MREKKLTLRNLTPVCTISCTLPPDRRLASTVCFSNTVKSCPEDKHRALLL